MKKVMNYPMAILLAFVTVMFMSCAESSEEELFTDDVITEEIQEGVLQAVTLEPDVKSSTAVFNGEIKAISEGAQVRYGFMWFNPKYSFQPPEVVELGVTGELQVFSITMTDLPANKDLVVCAFAEYLDESEISVGDEVDFTLPD